MFFKIAQCTNAHLGDFCEKKVSKTFQHQAIWSQMVMDPNGHTGLYQTAFQSQHFRDDWDM